ncbi:DNA-binding transcriptional response regulator [Granulicella arctica]|uniref:hypothetical protein n=1 Tax=Granulicella arctica TaxID=940613 RepID=UPI0021DF68E9|nr:hypothetical protein [Granulicella arctica]
MSLILIYGCEPTLLQTRAWVLETTGLETEVASDLSGLEEVLGQRPVDLMVLCHTLYPEEVRVALTRFHALQPNKQILILTDDPVDTAGEGAKIISPFVDAKTLISSVEEVLSRAS